MPFKLKSQFPALGEGELLKVTGERLVKNKISHDRLLLALENTHEAKQLDRKLLESISKGKRLNSQQFNEVYDILFKPGPCVKYNSPHKWERVTRDNAART